MKQCTTCPTYTSIMRDVAPPTSRRAVVPPRSLHTRRFVFRSETAQVQVEPHELYAPGRRHKLVVLESHDGERGTHPRQGRVRLDLPYAHDERFVDVDGADGGPPVAREGRPSRSSAPRSPHSATASATADSVATFSPASRSAHGSFGPL